MFQLWGPSRAVLNRLSDDLKSRDSLPSSHHHYHKMPKRPKQAAPPVATPKAKETYCDADADVSLVSSDGRVFKVYGYHLMSARYVLTPSQISHKRGQA